MESIRERFCNYFILFNCYKDYTVALQHQLPDGRFSDVDYTCESRSNWSISGHLRHTAALALQYRISGAKEFSDAANLSLTAWINKDYRNSNWWHNDIGVPQLLMHIALFLGDCILPESLEYVLSRLPDFVEEKWTGANRNWLAENVICKGLLSGNYETVRYGKDIVQGTIFVSERGVEGIQQDYSFAQHGMQLYNHGYGRSFLENSTKWAYIFHQSAFAFSAESIDILTKLALNGSFKMFRKQRMDFQPRSREIVRGCMQQPGSMQMYMQSLEVLIKLCDDEQSKRKLSEVKAHVVDGARMPSMESNNLYYCLDYMTHVKAEYYASVRWASKGVRGGDVQNAIPVNSENLLAGFGAYGVMCYLVDGMEYEKIAPVWDWGMLPGATTPHVELPIELGAEHESVFVGGVSDGYCGVMAADMHKTYCYEGKTSFSGKKACFMFEDVIVHLGCQLQTDAKQAFTTCYNQCLLKGDVFADGQPVKEKYFTDKCFGSVYHNNIAYYNLDGASLTLDTREKTGNWHRVYGADNISDSPISKAIFLLYRQQNKVGDTYAYAVVPGISATQYQSQPTLSGVEVVSNGNVQAVFSAKDRKLASVFYEMGVCVCGELSVFADKPCIVLYDIKKRVLYVTEPEGIYDSINILIKDAGTTMRANVLFDMDCKHKGKPVLVNL